MPYNKATYCGALVFLSACLSLEHVTAQELFPYARTNTPAVRAELRGGETVGMHQVKRAYITVGTNLFVFRVPTDCMMDASDSEKIVVSDLEHNWFIAISFKTHMPSPSDEAGKAHYRNVALNAFPTAIITGESAEFVGSRGGPVFELAWRNSGAATQSARVAFVPMATCLLEIKLVAGSEKFREGKAALQMILASMCTDEGGKIEITPLPDFS
jgi:hypothetical protein